jgi:hypothetical protein
MIQTYRDDDSAAVANEISAILSTFWLGDGHS